MDAGRELDALIVEKVMGLQVWHDGSYEGLAVGVGNQWIEIPRYSTDIAAAWQVVERLRLWVFPHDERWYAGRESNWGPDCLFMGEGVIDGRLSAFCEAETAPLAICRAALAVVVAATRC